ncbi:MAG: glycoside hydrolase family 127 protein [Treponema sp.]|nr:glycoside hydrolase family 127 protein [Treponema sp.]
MITDALRLFSVDDAFIGRYVRLVTDAVIPYQEDILNDRIPGVEKSHAVENYRLAAQMNEKGFCSGEFCGMVFQDSDVAKWLEAASYSLALRKDENLERRCDEMIELVGRAQQKDGYLDTYFTVKDSGKRWTNLREAHELYCAGHMMEAAVACYECTGKRKLLDIMCRMADHIYKHFITEKAPGYPGHPEVELALVRLYGATGEKRYLELARHFIDVRGVDSDYFKKESEERGWQLWGAWNGDKEYTQSHAPVREQKDAVGHAVRAVYLYSGMASVALETEDKELVVACRRLWKSITQKRMYVTGAIGSAYEGEAFTKDYHLPNDTAYGETCASIGLIFFARRMLELDKKAEYADVMERAFYNTVLAGMQLDGRSFFYVNALESLPGISGKAVTHRHALPVRPRWFACACCPPNTARLIASISRYAWMLADGGYTVYSLLFIGGTLDLSELSAVRIHVATAYPYDGRVEYVFEPCGAIKSVGLTLAVRLPEWSHGRVTCTMNGKAFDYEEKDSFANVKSDFAAGDRLVFDFAMEARRIYPSSRISADSGRIAFARGPLLYCAEGADNGGGVLNLRVRRDAKPELLPSDEGLFGVRKLSVKGRLVSDSETLYSDERPEEEDCDIVLVPYYAWANRGENEMRVWLPEE